MSAHVSGCEGKSQKLTSHARLIKAIRDGVENSFPEILANFRGPVSIGAKYHGNLPQVSLLNHPPRHGGCVGGHEIPLSFYRIDLADIFACRSLIYYRAGRLPANTARAPIADIAPPFVP